MTDRLQDLFEIGRHPLAFESSEELQEGSGWQLDRLRFRTDADEPVRGFLCRPKVDGPMPVVLVIHAHGNKYTIGANELMQSRAALTGPVGPALAARGIASLCMDMPCFGDRNGITESAAAKAALWRGRSLAGQMVGECHAAVGWLSEQPWAKADRIGVFGISMGATLGYWLAAVDGRVRALAQECCLADFQTLIDSGAHDLHGIYLTVRGLLDVASNGQIAGMVAPRAQFIGLGDLDPLTPPDAMVVALEQVRAAYAVAGGRLLIHREPSDGHVETAAMRAAMLDFMADALG
jgi:hypothetical protein